jgi:amino acid transporter
MAEETQNPSRNVPNAMTMSMVLSYVLGYIVSPTKPCRTAWTDTAKEHRHTSSGCQPGRRGCSSRAWLPCSKSIYWPCLSGTNLVQGYILERAVSHTGAISICCLLISVLLLQIMAQLQASSRFVFALARDDAMPFSESIRRTNSAKQPVIAHWLVVGLCAPFALLVIGSQHTLYSVLATTASCLSYGGYVRKLVLLLWPTLTCDQIVPVALYLLSKKDLESEGRSSWSLRKFR